MFTALHSKRNRPYRHTLVLVLLVSWISLTLSATCTMPLISAAMPEHMQGCAETTATDSLHRQDPAMQDCSLKPCLSSQTQSFPDFSRLPKLDLPVFILCLMAAFWSLFLNYPPVQFHRFVDPPPDRQVLLFYRFCKLLN